MPVDNLVDVACVLSPDLHYELLSKQGLAHAGLRTPDCEVVEFDTMAPAVASCCAACRTHGRSGLIEDTCNGVRRVWRDQQIKRTVDILHAKPLPYIVKLQQAMGGAGTLWIRTDKELVEVTRHISDVSLRNYLPRLDATNLHLKPVNLLLSDVIEGETRGILGLSRKTGNSPSFISCSTQPWSEGHH